MGGGRGGDILKVIALLVGHRELLVDDSPGVLLYFMDAHVLLNYLSLRGSPREVGSFPLQLDQGCQGPHPPAGGRRVSSVVTSLRPEGQSVSKNLDYLPSGTLFPICDPSYH